MAPACVDISHLTAGTAAERDAAAGLLLQSLTSCGYAKLINHGVSDGEVEELFKLVSSPQLYLDTPKTKAKHEKYLNFYDWVKESSY